MKATQRVVAVGVGAALLQAVMLIAFAWPAVNSEPRDLPLAVAGPQAPAVVEQLNARAPGTFEIAPYADEPAARQAIADREVYGAIITGGGPPRVLNASGAGSAVAQALNGLAQQLSGTPAVQAEDVVPAAPEDSRGAGFAAIALPLVMSGIAAGVLLTLVLPSAIGRLGGALSFAVISGLLSMAIVQGWLSILPGNYLLLAAAAGLVSFAVAGTVTGTATALGRAGLGLAALVMLLIGNPLSGATSAPELLPQPLGALGQLLPPGASASVLRSVAFFDGAGVGRPLLVVSAWAGLAVVLLAIGVVRARSSRSGHSAVDTSREPVPASA